MTRFEPRISGIASDRSTHWDTTTARSSLAWLQYTLPLNYALVKAAILSPPPHEDFRIGLLSKWSRASLQRLHRSQPRRPLRSFSHFAEKTVEQDLNLGLNLDLDWFLPAVVIRLHDGDLHTVNWGEGQWALVTPVDRVGLYKKDSDLGRWQCDQMQKWKVAQNFPNVVQKVAIVKLLKKCCS